MPRRAPYGSWVSPITASVIASGTIRLASPLIDRDEVYWLESRPTEGGRNVVARAGRALTPAPFNVRTRVHEYGGGALAVADGTIYFCNWGDQRIYRQRPDAQPERSDTKCSTPPGDHSGWKIDSLGPPATR